MWFVEEVMRYIEKEREGVGPIWGVIKPSIYPRKVLFTLEEFINFLRFL